MSESNHLDHLDRASEPLRHAVTGSVPPGAAAAIRRGRRRRAAGLVATGALAVAAVGGGVALAGPGGDGPGRDTLVAEAPSAQPRALPAPALLTPAVMEEVTQGWHTGWREVSQMGDTLVEGCIEEYDDSNLPAIDPDPEIDVQLVDADGTESFTALAQFDSVQSADRWTEALGATLTACAGEQERTEYAGGASVLHLHREAPATELWLVRFEDRLAFGALGPSDAPADADTATAYGDALLAALREDDSFDY